MPFVGPPGIIRDKGETRLQGPAAINDVNGTQGPQELKGFRPAGLGFIKWDAHLVDLPFTKKALDIHNQKLAHSYKDKK